MNNKLIKKDGKWQLSASKSQYEIELDKESKEFINTVGQKPFSQWTQFERRHYYSIRSREACL